MVIVLLVIVLWLPGNPLKRTITLIPTTHNLQGQKPMVPTRSSWSWNWAALHTDTITNRGAFTKDGIYTRALMHWCFYTGILLHDFQRQARISRFKSSASRCKTAISPQVLAIEMHFVGTGWPSASPHCTLLSLFGDQHFVRGGCVQSTPPCRPNRKIRKLHLHICHFNIILTGVILGKRPPPAPMYLPQHIICSCGSCV